MVSVANLIAICPIEMKVQRFGCHVQNPIHGIDERSNVDVFLTVLSSSLRNCYTSSMCDQSTPYQTYTFHFEFCDLYTENSGNLIVPVI